MTRSVKKEKRERKMNWSNVFVTSLLEYRYAINLPLTQNICSSCYCLHSVKLNRCQRGFDSLTCFFAQDQPIIFAQCHHGLKWMQNKKITIGDLNHEFLSYIRCKPERNGVKLSLIGHLVATWTVVYTAIQFLFPKSYAHIFILFSLVC